MSEASLRDVGVSVLVHLRWLCVLLVGIVAWADLVSADLHSVRGFFDSILEHWIWFTVTLLSTGYVIWDPGIRLSIRARRIRNQKDRVNYAVVGLDELSKLIRVRSTAYESYHKHFSKAVEPLLLAAEFELRVTLDLPEGTDAKVNLILLKQEDVIEVCGRSRAGSPVPVEYEIREEYPAAIAMRENTTSVMTLSSKDGKIDRPYRSIAATPIVVGGKAFGALTIDSPEPDIFESRDEEIDRVFRFYTGLFALTLGDDSTHWQCPKRYSR